MHIVISRDEPLNTLLSKSFESFPIGLTSPVWYLTWKNCHNVFRSFKFDIEMDFSKVQGDSIFGFAVTFADISNG